MFNMSVVEVIKHYQRSIEKCQDNKDRVLHCIGKLYRLPVTVQHLQDTGIGRTVNALRKYDGDTGEAAKALVAKWKAMVAAEDSSDGEEHPDPEENNNSPEEEQQQSHRQSEQEHHRSSKDKSSHRKKYREEKSAKVKKKSIQDESRKRRYEEENGKSAEKKRRKQETDSDSSDEDRFQVVEPDDSGHDSDANQVSQDSGEETTPVHHGKEREKDSSEETTPVYHSKEREKDRHHRKHEKHKDKASSSSSHKEDRTKTKEGSKHRKDEKRKVESKKHKSKSAHSAPEPAPKIVSSDKKPVKVKKEKPDEAEDGSIDCSTDTPIAKTPVVNEIPPWKWVIPEHSIQIPGNHSKNDSPYILKLDTMELLCSTYKDHLQIYTDGSLNPNNGTSGAGYYIPKYQESYFIPCSSSSSLDTELLAIDAALQIIPIQKQLSKLKELQKEITFQWIPSHCGIPGNEKVDDIAKQATYLQPRPLQVISLSSAFASVKSHFTNLWINNWLSSDKGKILQSIQKKPNDLEMYKNFPRHVQTFLTRARAGHIVTQLYLHRFHISDNPTCLWCNNHDEDLEYILLYCPSINHKRRASFAEALGMVDPIVKKKHISTPSPGTSSSASSPRKSSSSLKKKDISSGSSSSSSKATILANELGLLSPNVKLEPLEVEVDLAATLPAITPNYKPLPHYNLLDSPPHRKTKHLTEEEALSQVMSTKNQRTKVYSGVKSGKSWATVPSLYDICVRVLQENIDALEYTGGVPYDLLKPVLQHATPEQLFMLEHYNPYLIEDTGDLWQFHCQREFRSKQRQDMETAREMYINPLPLPPTYLSLDNRFSKTGMLMEGEFGTFWWGDKEKMGEPRENPYNLSFVHEYQKPHQLSQMFFKLSDNILCKIHKINKQEIPVCISDTLIAKTPVVNEVPSWKWVIPEHSIQIPGNHSKNDPPCILKLDAVELLSSTYKNHLQIYTDGSLNPNNGTSEAASRRCLDEREAKLKALTTNIQQSIAKSTPVRQTKLAYVDSIAKPPRNVARQQAKFGTAHGDKLTPAQVKTARAKAKAGATAGAVPAPAPVRHIQTETVNIRYPPQNWLHLYTDGSLISREKGAGAGVTCCLFSLYRSLGYGTISFDGEIIAISESLRNLLCHINKFRNAVILSDSKAAILSIISKHTPSSQTAETTKMLSQLISLNKRIVFQWIPSHCGILGNENADALAKKGSTASYRHVTKSTYYSVKRFIKSTYLDFNKQNLITQSQGKKWNSLHQNPQLIPDLPRKSSVAAFRLTTGHDCLAKHLHRIGIYQSPNCPLCNSNQEMDSEHLKSCASLAGHDNIFEKYWSARGQMTLLRLRWAGHVACMGESRNTYRVLVGRPEGKRPLGRPRRRWEDNIKMDLREVGYDDRDWINLAQDRDRWRAYVRAAMNLRYYLQIRTTSSQFTVLLSQSLEFTVSRTTDLQRQFTVLELGSLQLRSTALELRSLQLRSTALELRPSDADADADAHSSRTPAHKSGLLALAYSLTE
ncbi:hypothetical protein ANN_06701 [Periplaneta americana]|uniref:RNase H type-1 domain-containing protein n=1 Tax=Periplaneta americana TaxID=6978 RepID=A0ABQ8TG41_PERAM|nr:hypothetical protein ANN_06701 [Periplaneta americana]